jgi:urate oxidase
MFLAKLCLCNSSLEYTARVLLEGDIETSYTKADNSVVVATDTVKNTVYSESTRLSWGITSSSY